MQVGNFTLQLKHQLLILSILSFLLYANTLNHSFVLDDFSILKDNWVVQQGIDGIQTIFTTPYRYGYWNSTGTLYRPLTLTMFAIEWQIAPDSPSLHHWINVLAYAGCICLLLLFLYQLFDKKYHPWLFVATLLFAVHPIHTEVVANIKSRDEIMSFASLLLGFLLFFKYQKKNFNIAVATLGLLFLVGLLFKEGIVMFLFLFPILLFLKQKNKAHSAASFVAMGVGLGIYLIMRNNAIGSVSDVSSVVEFDNFLVGIDNSSDKLATAIKLIGVYLLKLIVPYPLSNDYSIPHFSVSTFADWKVWATILSVAGIVFYTIKKQLNDLFLLTGVLVLFGTLVLYSNIFITIGSHFGDRFLFLPSLGSSLIIVWGLMQLKNATPKQVLYITTPILLVFSGMTFNRNKAWKDNFTLYETDVKQIPNSSRTHYYYGLGLMKDRALSTDNQQEKINYLNRAQEEFKESIRLYPNHADAWTSLGLANYRLGNKENALHFYNEALKRSPSLVNAHSNKGTVLFEQGKYNEAIAAFHEAIKYNPRHVDALGNLAAAYGTIGRFNEAVQYFHEALKYAPDNKNYMRMLGMTYQSLNQPKEANYWLAKAQ